ncbi:hypothetical protein K458DRAFT_444784 [Lentithecium fluviatile CBS 122367]|uniref:Rhodopsin domain-containing protein n=1 Tax=Lentithecium fluviatile CBS 122367 TaxID=1168545 RepID=A0A6G1IT41_9PLEO|nr:hypothetical protein K458DRAFT_444784 [Lentithecium fluviatile CBS 122367]
MPPLPSGTDVWKVPASKPPPGFTSNLVNPATNENIGVVTLSIFIALAAICVCLRFYVRFRMGNHKPCGIYFGLFIVTTMYTAWMFIFIFQTAFQNQVGQRLSWAQAGFNLTTDVYIILLPISGSIRLHLSPKRKVGLLCVFFSGIAAIIMSCLTLYWRVQYNGVSPDPTWTATTRMTISVLKIDIGVMFACTPLFATFLPKKSHFTNFTGYFRSMRSRLLSSNSTQASKDTKTGSQYGNVSDIELVQNNGVYVELGERKSASSSARDVQPQRREWFDGATTLMDETVIDRASKDVSQMIPQPHH